MFRDRRQRLPRSAVPARAGRAGSSSVAPQVRLELLPLSGEFDYRRSLASGEVDLVIGNWLEPPGELHLGRLMSRRDRLPGRRRPPGRARRPAAAGPSSATWPASTSRRRRCIAGAPGVIDEHLATLGPDARRRGAQRALQPDPADGRAEPAGADDRAPVLLALRRRAAGAHRALPGRVPAADLLPALARPDARVAGGALAARAGARRRAQPGSHGMLQRGRGSRGGDAGTARSRPTP